MLDRAKVGLVLMERVNVSPATLLPTGQTCLGFDGFFFAKEIARFLDVDDQLVVGQPWWGYWLPVGFDLKGYPLYMMGSPLLWHLDHEQGWSQQRWLDTGRRLLTYLASEQEFSSHFDVTAFNTPDQKAREDLGGFGNWLLEQIRTRAATIASSEHLTFDDLFSNFLRRLSHFDGMHSTTLALANANQILIQLGENPLDLLKLRDRLETLQGSVTNNVFRRTRKGLLSFESKAVRIIQNLMGM